jgi:hypothetical protein
MKIRRFQFQPAIFFDREKSIQTTRRIETMFRPPTWLIRPVLPQIRPQISPIVSRLSSIHLQTRGLSIFSILTLFSSANHSATTSTKQQNTKRTNTMSNRAQHQRHESPIRRLRSSSHPRRSLTKCKTTPNRRQHPPQGSKRSQRPSHILSLRLWQSSL